MQFPPSLSKPEKRSDTRPETTPQLDANQTTGADTPRQRTTLDNSRALPPDYLGMHPDGRLRVSRDIQQLLSLRNNHVDLNADTGEVEDDEVIESDMPRIALKSAFAEPARAALPAINPNVPRSNYRYLSMSLPALLQEVADRAIGEGPPDSASYTLPTALPENRRLGDMVWALQYQPGRERDAQVMRNAGAALTDFFPVYRRLVALVRERRPDLEPVMSDWTAWLTAEPLRKALAMPLGPDGEPIFESGRIGELREVLERPYEVHIAELDARMTERRRFSELPLLGLLEEAAQRAVGNGPPDIRTPTNAAMAPESNRINDMARVLQTVPGRHNDAVTLRNAGRQLAYLFSEVRALLRDIRSRRPDLEPVLQPWIRNLVRSGLQRALDIPGIGDRSFKLNERISWDISRVARQPIEGYLATLDRQLMQHLEPGFIARFPDFFRQMSGKGQPGESAQNIIRGASSSESGGTHAKGLLQGKVVFSCTEAQLATNLQMIPAATMTAVPAISTFRGPGGWRLGEWVATYPRGTGERWLQAVSWQPPGGSAMPVFVSLIAGVHSYSTDKGLSWKPTGGPGFPVMDLIRTERWSEFLAQRSVGAY